jgi:hypothetical protein
MFMPHHSDVAHASGNLGCRGEYDKEHPVEFVLIAANLEDAFWVKFTQEQ